MGTSKPIEVRQKEVVINEQRFTTPEQTMEAMKKAAEQARAQVFADMKNKPSVRRSLGM